MGFWKDTSNHWIFDDSAGNNWIPETPMIIEVLKWYYWQLDFNVTK